jgi:hypothetical protein
MKAVTATKRSTVIGSKHSNSPRKGAVAKAWQFELMHCPIASNSNLATYLDHLAVGQFQNICNTNGVTRHRSKDSFLPTRDTSATLPGYDRLVTDVKCYIVAIHFDTLCPAVVEYG